MSMNESLDGVMRWRQRLDALRRWLRRTAPFVSGVLATFVALLLYNLFVPDPERVTSGDVNETVAVAIASITPAPPHAPLIYQLIRPSLVLIQTHSPGKDDEEDNGLGTGVVINDSGDILTSLHVVTNTLDIELTFADGTESVGVIVAAEPASDIAVVRPAQLPELLVPAVLGNPNALRIGDEAFAVGHPLGLYGSMSAGVVSGLNRSFRPPNSDYRLQGLIQIDAAVNPGNSGGPLLNRNGQVIGIVTGLANPTDDNFFIGIGFAVPINVAGGAAGLPPY
jgi:S1-C subfamily serine protease